MSVVLVLCMVLVFYLSPRVGHSNVLVYISICSLLGAFTVSSVKGLAIAINTGQSRNTFFFLQGKQNAGQQVAGVVPYKQKVCRAIFVLVKD